VAPQAILAVVMTKHHGKLAVLKELFLVLTCLRPAVEIWRLAHGAEHDPGAPADPKAAMIMGKMIERVLESVEGFDRNGEFRVIERPALPMRYREGGLPHGFLVTHATLRLSPDGVAEEAAAIRHHLDRRKATQPLHLPSCGSTFRNPPGAAAGALIEAAGLKGYRVGGAQISEKHANFIVNLGEATASDVMGCIRAAWEGVRAHAGVTMVPEVHVVGDWDTGVWPLA
jgi:UDP-N-acetylmuramate dehydrogenase